MSAVRLALDPPSVTVGVVEDEGVRISRGEQGVVLETRGSSVRVRRSLAREIVVPAETRFQLEPGDVLWREGLGRLIDDEATARAEDLEVAAVSSWGDEAAWGVLGDWLLDRGDRLGERITHALGRRSWRPLAPHTWIGATWRHGVLQRVAITRPEWATNVPWREALLEILVAREARFLEELSLDLARLEPEATVDELHALSSSLLALPWPRWLRRLHFGVAAGLSRFPPGELLDRVPRLPHADLFGRGERAQLVLESASDRAALEGLERDRTPLADGFRVRVFPSKVLFERPVWPRYDSWPSWDFAFHDGRWFLSWRHGAPRSDEVKINGMEFFNACLVPGDRIEIGEQVTLRFELG